MTIKTTLGGARELDRVLKQLPKALRGQVLENAVRAGANVVRKEARARAPRGADASHPSLGRLADNLRVSKDKRGANSVDMLLHTGKAFWGMFLEFGTSKVPARPWFRPALDRMAGAALGKIGERVGKNVEKRAAELAGKFGKISRATRRRL